MSIKKGINILTILLAVLTAYLIFQNVFMYQDARSEQDQEEQPEETNKGVRLPVRTYEGAKLSYTVSETEKQARVYIDFDNSQISYTGLDLTFIYNTDILGKPIINKNSKLISIPQNGTKYYSLADSNYEIVHLNLLANNIDGLNKSIPQIITIDFPKKADAIIQYYHDPVWLLADTTLDNLNYTELKDVRKLLSQKKIKSQVILHDTSYFVRVDTNPVSAK